MEMQHLFAEYIIFFKNPKNSFILFLKCNIPCFLHTRQNSKTKKRNIILLFKSGKIYKYSRNQGSKVRALEFSYYVYTCTNWIFP